MRPTFSPRLERLEVRDLPDAAPAAVVLPNFRSDVSALVAQLLADTGTAQTDSMRLAPGVTASDLRAAEQTALETATMTESARAAVDRTETRRTDIAARMQALQDTLNGLSAQELSELTALTSLGKRLTDARASIPSLVPTVATSDLFSTSTNGWGPVERDRSNAEAGAGDGRTITMRGLTYAKGLGVHAPSTVTLAPGGKYTQFEAMVGIDDETRGNGSVIFQVWGDGRKLFDSGVMTGTTAARAVSVDLTNIQSLKLVVTDGGNGNTFDHADWANARLTAMETGGLRAVDAANLLITSQSNAWGPMERNRSNGERGATDGRTLKLRGVSYATGLGVHAPSSLAFPAGGKYARFESVIGVDDETSGAGRVVFQVWGDGKKLYDSGIMTGTMPAKQVSVDLAGVQSVRLLVTDAGNGATSDHADWANARFIQNDAALRAQTAVVAGLEKDYQTAGTRLETTRAAIAVTQQNRKSAEEDMSAATSERDRAVGLLTQAITAQSAADGRYTSMLADWTAQEAAKEAANAVFAGNLVGSFLDTERDQVYDALIQSFAASSEGMIDQAERAPVLAALDSRITDAGARIEALRTSVSNGGPVLTAASQHLTRAGNLLAALGESAGLTDEEFAGYAARLEASLTTFETHLGEVQANLDARAGAVTLTAGPGNQAKRALTISVRSSLPQSYVEIRSLNGQNWEMATPTVLAISHPNGTNGSTVQFGVPNASPTFKEDIQVTLYADAAKTTVLGTPVRIKFGHGDAAVTMVSGATSLAQSALTTTQEVALAATLVPQAEKDALAALETQVGIEAAMALAAAQEIVEVTPSVSVTRIGGSYRLSYSNMPADMYWQTTKKNEAGYVLSGGDLPEGNGTVFIDAPGAQGEGQIVIKNGVTGETYQIGAQFAYANHRITAGPASAECALTEIAYQTTRGDAISFATASAGATYDFDLSQLGTFPNLRREMEEETVRRSGLWPTVTAYDLARECYPAFVGANLVDAASGMQQDLNRVLTQLQAAASSAFGEILASRTGQPASTEDRVARALQTQNPGVAWILGRLGLTPDAVRTAVRANFDAVCDEAARLHDEQEKTVAQINAMEVAAGLAHEAMQLAAGPTATSKYPRGGYTLGNPAERVAVSPSLAGLPEDVRKAYEQYAWNVANKVRVALRETVIAQVEQVLAANTDSDIDGIGGAKLSNAVLGIDLSPTDQALFQNVMHWYDGRPFDLSFSIAQDSAAARIFLGLLTQLPSKSLLDQVQIAKNVEQATLIPYNKILAAYQKGNSNITAAAEQLRSLFESAGYAHFFGGNSSTLNAVSLPPISQTPALTQRHFSQIHVHHGEDGVVQGEDVLLRFDLQTGGSTLSHIYAYLIDSSGNQIGGPLTAEIHGLAARISQSEINARLGSGPRKIQIKLAAWFTDSGDKTIAGFTDGFFFLKANVPINVQNGDFSTSTNIEDAKVENHILKQMLFPLEGTNWNYALTSPYHRGNGLLSLDLNLGGDADRGALVHAPISGTIQAGGVKLLDGKVTMNTVIDGNAVKVTFYHMEHILKGVTGMDYVGLGEAIHSLGLLQKYASDLPDNAANMQTSDLVEALDAIPAAKLELQPYRDRIAVAQAKIDKLLSAGLSLSQGDLLGGAGDEGLSWGTHLHMEAQLNGKPLNLFGWANAYIPNAEISGTVDARGTLQFHYDATAKTLVNNAERIAILRVDKPNAAGQIVGCNEAYAWVDGRTVDQMEKISWVLDKTTNTSLWIQIDSGGNPILQNGKANHWTGNGWEFISIQL